jgi:hypothetical protein
MGRHLGLLPAAADAPDRAPHHIVPPATTIGTAFDDYSDGAIAKCEGMSSNRRANHQRVLSGRKRERVLRIAQSR